MEDKKIIKTLYVPATLSFTPTAMLLAHTISVYKNEAMKSAYSTMNKSWKQYRRRVKWKAFWWRIQKFLFHN